MDYFLVSFIITACINMFVFLIAYTLQTDVLTDFTGSVCYIVVALFTLLDNEKSNFRAWAASLGIVVARVYLGLFLFWRASSKGGDNRFDKFRASFVYFGIFWLFQILWVYVTLLPIIYINAADCDGDATISDYIILAFFVVGFFFESVGDIQKFMFKNAGNKGIMTEGLWACTRHPNYFGEMVMWWSFFAWGVVQNIECEDNWYWLLICALSPLITMLILLFGTGMPTAEGSALKRFEKRGMLEEWNEYAAKTSPIIPFCCYGGVPDALKSLCFCEFASYQYTPPSPSSENASSNETDYKLMH